MKFRRSRVALAVLERWAASQHLGPLMRDAIRETVEAQRKAVLLRLRAVALDRLLDRFDRRTEKAGVYMIDEPSPFAPIDELRRFLEAMRSLPQDDPSVQAAILFTKDALEWREACEKCSTRREV